MESRRLLIIDATATLLTAAAVVLALWCGVFDLPRHRTSAQRSNQLLGSLDGELRALAVKAAKQREQVAALEADIASRGALPSEVPIEAHLRLVDELARGHGLELSQVTPLDRQEHATILETRYEMQGQCRFEGLLTFLAAFEEAALWADITELRVMATSAGNGGASPRRSVRFVLSLYASQTAPALAEGRS